MGDEILADLLFAYLNKDETFPHEFEILAVEKAINYLKDSNKKIKYNINGFEKYLEKMKAVSKDVKQNYL